MKLINFKKDMMNSRNVMRFGLWIYLYVLISLIFNKKQNKIFQRWNKVVI